MKITTFPQLLNSPSPAHHHQFIVERHQDKGRRVQRRNEILTNLNLLCARVFKMRRERGRQKGQAEIHLKKNKQLWLFFFGVVWRAKLVLFDLVDEMMRAKEERRESWFSSRDEKYKNYCNYPIYYIITFLLLFYVCWFFTLSLCSRLLCVFRVLSRASSRHHSSVCNRIVVC